MDAVNQFIGEVLQAFSWALFRIGSRRFFLGVKRVGSGFEHRHRRALFVHLRRPSSKKDTTEFLHYRLLVEVLYIYYQAAAPAGHARKSRRRRLQRLTTMIHKNEPQKDSVRLLRLLCRYELLLLCIRRFPIEAIDTTYVEQCVEEEAHTRPFIRQQVHLFPLSPPGWGIVLGLIKKSLAVVV